MAQSREEHSSQYVSLWYLNLKEKMRRPMLRGAQCSFDDKSIRIAVRLAAAVRGPKTRNPFFGSRIVLVPKPEGESA